MKHMKRIIALLIVLSMGVMPLVSAAVSIPFNTEETIRTMTVSRVDNAVVGTTYDLTLDVSGNTGVNVIRGTINYDPDFATVTDVTVGELVSGNILCAFNYETEGVIRFALTSEEPLTAGGAILNIQANLNQHHSAKFELTVEEFYNEPIGGTQINYDAEIVNGGLFITPIVVTVAKAQPVEAGVTYTLPVSISEGAYINTLAGVINYNPELAVVTAVEATEEFSGEGCVSAFNLGTPGEIRFALASDLPITELTNLFNIEAALTLDEEGNAIAISDVPFTIEVTDATFHPAENGILDMLDDIVEVDGGLYFAAVDIYVTNVYHAAVDTVSVMHIAANENLRANVIRGFITYDPEKVAVANINKSDEVPDDSVFTVNNTTPGVFEFAIVSNTMMVGATRLVTFDVTPLVNEEIPVEIEVTELYNDQGNTNFIERDGVIYPAFPVTLDINEVIDARHGQQYMMAVSISEKAYVNVIEGEITYDASKLIASDIIAGVVAEGANVVFDTETSGRIGFTISNDEYITQAGEIVTFNVQLAEGVYNQCIPLDLTITALKYAAPYVSIENAVEVDCSVTGGSVTTVAAYTVTFVDSYNDEVLSTQIIEQGDAAIAPDAPIHEGYRFSRWDADFAAISSDLTVNAIYVLVGDIDMNDGLSVNDALTIMRYALGLIGEDALTSDQLVAADMNGDGAVTAVDALMVLFMLMNA